MARPQWEVSMYALRDPSTESTAGWETITPFHSRLVEAIRAAKRRELIASAAAIVFGDSLDERGCLCSD